MGHNLKSRHVFGSGSERRNESTKKVEMKVPKYYSRGSKTGAPKIPEHQKIIALFKRFINYSNFLHLTNKCSLSFGLLNEKIIKCSNFLSVPYMRQFIMTIRSPDHSKTEPEHRHPRWLLFGQIWNGQDVRF